MMNDFVPNQNGGLVAVPLASVATTKAYASISPGVAGASRRLYIASITVSLRTAVETSIALMRNNLAAGTLGTAGTQTPFWSLGASSTAGENAKVFSGFAVEPTVAAATGYLAKALLPAAVGASVKFEFENFELPCHVVSGIPFGLILKNIGALAGADIDLNVESYLFE